MQSVVQRLRARAVARMRSRVDAMRAEGVGGQAHGNHRYLVAVEAEQ